MNIDIRWTSHLSNEADKKYFKENLSASQKVVERLKDLMDEDFEVSCKEMAAKTNLDNPNWANHQAFLMGMQAYINKIKALLPEYS